MSTRTALTIVGGVVGAYFGYPQLGLVIGGLIGGAVDPQQIQGPKIGEVNVQTSQKGAPRTIVYGTIACYGNIIQTGQVIKVETSESQGKGGGPEVTSERAYRTFAIRVCEGPIGGYLRVWEDNKLVYDIRPGSVMVAESQKWASNKVFYLGDETQLPDPTLVASVNADSPSYRGSAYMVANTEDVTDRRGSIAQYRFEVSKTLEPPEVMDISDSAVIPVYLSGGIPVYSYVYLNYLHSSDEDSATHVSVASNLSNAWYRDGSTNYLIHELDESCDIVETDAFPLIPGGNWSLASPTPASTLFTLGAYGQTVLTQGTNYPTGSQLYLTSGGSMNAVLVPDVSSLSYWYATNTPSGYAQNGRHVWLNENGVYLGVVERSGVAVNNIHFWGLGSTGTAPDFRVDAVASIIGVCVTPGNQFLMHLARDGKLRVINDVGSYSVYSAALSLESTEVLPFSITNLSAFGVDEEIAVFVFSTGSVVVRQLSDWSTIATYTNSVFNTKANGNRVIFTDGNVFFQAQDTVLRAEYQASVVGQPVLLSEIVSDIHDRCGFESIGYDVAELTALVDGLGLAGDYTGASAIDTLRPVYFFDKSEHDKKLWYPKRGAAVIETLTIDDLTEVPDTTNREQAIEVPKKLHLRYQHAASGYAPVKATAAASSPNMLTTGEAQLEVPVVLNEDQAAQAVDKMYKVTRSEIRGTTEITVPLDIGAKYVAGNCIGLSLRGRLTRERIEQQEFDGLKIKLTLKPDRQSAYTSDLTGVPIPDPTPPPSTLVGETEIAVLDISARVDSEDDLNYLVAVSGRLPPWYGATYQRSLDNGASYVTVLDIEQASVMGEITNSVADASEYFTDTTNTINVELYRSTQSLESISETQFLSEGGAFALEKSDGSWEICQYLDAVENSDGSFTLSTLHRGLLNSGTSSHVAGDRLVMLARPSHIPAQSSWIGSDLTHRAISFGESADDTDNEFTAEFVGRSQIEWPVAYLELTRSGSDISATWTPRHRFGSDDAPVASINFQGYRVTLDGGSNGSVTFDTTTAGFTNYDATSLGGGVTVSVSALNRITGAGPATSGTI